MRPPLIRAAALLLAVAPVCAADNSVSGVVVDSRSHAPLANARVSLASTSQRAQKLEQVTKQDGRFSFNVETAGKYELRIAKPGYPPQSYRQPAFSGVSSAVVVGDGQDTRQIVFEAYRASAIAGQIKDEESEPVGNALVAIFRVVVQAGERRLVRSAQARANAVGEFRFSNLPRGSYYVCAMGRPWFADSLIGFDRLGAFLALERISSGLKLSPEQQEALKPNQPSPDPNFRGTAFATTFYPNSPTVEEASAIQVEAGGEAQISITLPFATAVSITGAISLSGEISGGQVNLVKKIGGQTMTFLEATAGKDGSFRFDNVPSGLYEIEAASQSSSGPSSWTIRQDVLVGASDMQVTLRPPSMGSLSGKVVFADGAALPGSLFVFLRNENGAAARAEVGAGGTYSLNRLPPGPYEVTAAFSNYIAAYLTGPGGEQLPLTTQIAPGVTGHYDLTMARAASVIQGTVERAGVPQVGAFVLLMPKDPAQLWAYRMDQSDSDGSFRLATVPTGDYLVIALSEGGEIAYRDPKIAAILTRSANPVHIEPNTVTDLKLEIVDAASLSLPRL